MLTEIELPTSLDGLTAERVRMMSHGEREVLEKAAVVGETFLFDAVMALLRCDELADNPDGPSLEAIASAGEHSRARVSAALSRLLETGWVAVADAALDTGGPEYRFLDPQMRATVYRALPATQRRGHHRVVSQWLELCPAGRTAHALELAGYHLEQAGETQAAAARYRRAGDAARRDFHNGEAVRLYSRALACLAVTDVGARLHVWHDLGSIFELTGDYSAALTAFEHMLRLAWVASSRLKAAVAFNKIGRVWRRRGDLALALEYLDRGRQLFEQSGDTRGIIGSLDDLGAVLHLLGRSEEAHAAVSRGLKLREQRGDRRALARSLANLGNIQRARGLTAEALECHHRALELRRQVRDRVGVIGSLSDLAWIAYERGDLAAARSAWEQAHAAAAEIGALPLHAAIAARLSELALDQGAIEQARSRLNEAQAIAEDMQEQRLLAEISELAARVELRSGALQPARQLAETAYNRASAAGLLDCEARALLALAEAAEPSNARGLWTRAVDTLRRQESSFELARGLERYGRYQQAVGDQRAARAALAEAISLYRQRGGVRASTLEESLL
jgi:tetratricopeptide (TPR) repeat protein